MAATLETNFDIVIAWLQKVAENTAIIRDQTLKAPGAPGGGGGGGAADPARGWMERALGALGKQFESGVTQLRRAPVEQVIASAFDASIRNLGGALTAGLSGARGLATRGFAGTVEGARYDFAMEYLAKQFAAVMQPVMAALTYGAEQLERRMRGLSGGDQNRLLGAGLGAAAGSRFGPLGLLAGAALGAQFGGGDSAAGYGLSVAGAAYFGGRLAGPAGALAAGTVAAATLAPAQRPDEKPSEYYARMRAGGASQFDATLATLGRSVSVLVGGTARGVGIETDVGAARAATPPAPAAPRRDVTPYNPAMTEAGGFHFAAQQAVIRATAGEGTEADAGPFKPLVDLGLQAITLLAQLVGIASGGTVAPAPTPAGGA